MVWCQLNSQILLWNILLGRFVRYEFLWNIFGIYIYRLYGPEVFRSLKVEGDLQASYMIISVTNLEWISPAVQILSYHYQFI